jgi:hypothetical protein
MRIEVDRALKQQIILLTTVIRVVHPETDRHAFGEGHA